MWELYHLLKCNKWLTNAANVLYIIHIERYITMKAFLMAAVMAFTPTAALAHHEHHHHRDNTGDAAIILGGALVLGGILINSQDDGDHHHHRRRHHHHHHYHHYRVEPTYVVETYWRHGRRYRVCRQGHKEFYC